MDYQIKYTFSKLLAQLARNYLDKSLHWFQKFLSSSWEHVSYFVVHRPPFRQFVLDQLLGLKDLAEFDDIDFNDGFEVLSTSPVIDNLIENTQRQITVKKKKVRRSLKKALAKLLLPLIDSLEKSLTKDRKPSRGKQTATKGVENRYKSEWSP